MYKLPYRIIGIFFLTIGCKSQDKVVDNISCSGKLALQYDKIKPSDRDNPIADLELDAFTVYFLSEFKDSIHGYVNDKLVFEKYVNRGADSDNLDYYFGYNYSADSSVPILKVLSLTKDSCFDIPIDKKYKLVYLFLDEEGNWTVRYSNIYYLH